MTQKYIVGDIVEYDNKVMVVKEPRDGSHFDLSCPKEGLVYCFVGVDKIKPVRITPEILKKNGWKKVEYGPYGKGRIEIEQCNENEFMYCKGDLKVVFLYAHSLQHFLFGLGLNSEMEV